MFFEELRQEFTSKRKARDELDRVFQRDRETLRTLGVRKGRLGRLGQEDSAAYQEIERREAQLKDTLPSLQRRLQQAQSTVDDLLIKLTEFQAPDRAVENLDDSVPFLLLPVRLETRFKQITDPETGAVQSELWLRIYPDDIHIYTHEETLTEDELSSAQSYWCEVWRAGGDKALELAAWRVLVREYGPQRAAWMVREYRPNNELDENGNSNRPSSPLADDETLSISPSFDPYEPKQESWSRAAHALAMPDRFVVIGYAGAQEVIKQIGNPIPDPLIVGPNPSHPEPTKEGFKADSKALEVDAEMKWMVDFDEAVRVGMGMRIKLTPRTAIGVSRLVVLGLRLSADASEGQRILEQLIETHHYSEDGFSLVPQGTATNNTGSGGSGFRSFDLGDDASFTLELDKPLFKDEPDWTEKRDGQYLAEALGINPALLHHIQFSDGLDRHDAKAMNVALWPATLGYFLEEMMDPLVDAATVKKARAFFTAHVLARGPLPAVRVGTQPYGILPTSSFSRWRYPEQAVYPGDAMLPAPAYEFEKRLYSFLTRLDTWWDSLVEKTSYVGKDSDTQKTLLDILGLHADSVEYYNRFAVSDEMIRNLLNLNASTLTAVDLDIYFKRLYSTVLSDFGVEEGEQPEILKKVYFKAQTLLDGPFIDDAPLSETTQLKAISEGGENYIKWLATSPIDTIRRQDFGRKNKKDVPAPQTLLYLMLRHAVMNAFWDTAWNFYYTAQVAEIPNRKESAFLYIKEQNPGESKFALMYRPAGELSQKHPTVFMDPKLTIAEQISNPQMIQARPESQSLREVREALECLYDRPTQKLARVFSEHIDLCAYRLDAWKLGLVNQRLAELRGSGETINQGIYLGAFGWLEEVRPQQNLQPFEEWAPQEFQDRNDPPLQAADGNQGYIHAPSLNHAITSAILRNAYITHADRKHPSVMSVNLTSERVRTALSTLEGVRAGQELGALLGYQLERGLHDRYLTAEVDKFIFPLRKAFPLVADKIEKTNDDVPIEAIEARNVIDGVELIQHIQKTEKRSYPFGKPGLPKASADQAKIIDSEVRRMVGTMDALSDLLTAESVYQVVRGNHERAAAVMDALSKAETIPEVEITQTPRSGLAMTHRLCLHFATDIPATQLNPYAGEVTLTPRAEAEPGLNSWLAGLIGKPADIVCRVVRVEEGMGPGGENIEHKEIVSLKDLQIQPIDLLYILDEHLEQNESELDKRIDFAFRSREKLARDTTLRIEYTEPVEGKITFFQFMPLLKCLRTLILESRALNAQDLVLPTDEAKDLDEKAATDPDPKGWTGTDIGTRVKAAHDALEKLKNDIESSINALSTAPVPGEFEFTQMRERLMLTAAFGIQQSIPESAVEISQGAAKDLIEQANSVKALIKERLKEYDKLAVPAAKASIEDQVGTWIEAGRRVFGPSFVWMSTFSLKLAKELKNAHGDSEHILRHIEKITEFPVDEWLHGLARVRPKAACLERVVLLTETFAKPAPHLTPIQLPYQADDHWLAMEYPAKYKIDRDRLLLASVFATPTISFAENKRQTGLLLDEWVDVVPTKNETTGLCLHYDAPNAVPPQSLLLAVTPQLTGSWKWDDLVATLNETLDMAKNRAVEPQHLDDKDLAQFLPATMVPTAPYLVAIATNLLANLAQEHAPKAPTDEGEA